MNNEKQRQAAAKNFAEYWLNRGSERAECQKFWLQLLSEVFGIENVNEFISFEKTVKSSHANFIDAYIKSTRVMIEQKSSDKDLRKPILQSDGSLLTPFQQAKKYIAELPVDEHPKYVVTCNFRQFFVYDMNQPNGEPQRINLKDLPTDIYRLQFLVESRSAHIEKELQVSMQAGELVGKIYDALYAQYHPANIEITDEQEKRILRYLNILCVRLVFCLYAEDAGVFPRHDMFHDYLNDYSAEQIREALIRLFEVLNTQESERSPYTSDTLKAFPYTNGGLFDEHIEIPQFTEQLRNLLLKKASLDFNWSEISPTIFGAVFESTLNPETRRSGGMHYTSIENIHKVIDPLFLDQLTQDLDTILEEKNVKKRQANLKAYQDHLASLTFFDPACGSGNFLTETFLSLRRLENRMIQAYYHETQLHAFEDPIKVNIHQFYGIEINDFAVSVATTALWISEAQMLNETERIVKQDIDFLPLKSYANIHEGNALQIDWRNVVNAEKLNYIIGNPPFVGAKIASDEQKVDLYSIFGKKWKFVGKLDYVACWFKKAVDFINNTQIKVAFVATNSITQGEQAAALWKPLLKEGVHINYAYKTFQWDSESNLKAHVHCVIIGFSFIPSYEKYLFDANGNKQKVNHINSYLLDAPDAFIYGRSQPLCNVPNIRLGNQPIDDGNYLFTAEEKDEFIKKEPKSAQYFKKWYGASEFINQQPRYCLWLGDCSPAELRAMPLCMKRVANVREFRLRSKNAGTRKLADCPTRFHVENMPNSNYVMIPATSSQRRRYIPIGYMEPNIMASNANLIIRDSTLYHFGILTSNVHMAWMRVVCGRLKSDYRYSNDVVYNNFPWPSVSHAQAEKIAQTAQGILDARAQFADSSLADLYDEVAMPPVLRAAHVANDRAVMEAYGFDWHSMTESECVARLFDMYNKLVEQND